MGQAAQTAFLNQKDEETRNLPISMQSCTRLRRKVAAHTEEASLRLAIL
jgi:hypothetical protein